MSKEKPWQINILIDILKNETKKKLVSMTSNFFRLSIYVLCFGNGRSFSGEANIHMASKINLNQLLLSFFNTIFLKAFWKYLTSVWVGFRSYSSRYRISDSWISSSVSGMSA